MRYILALVVMMCLVGCEPEHKRKPEHTTKYLNKELTVPSLNFKVKYGFTHKGKTFKFVDPSERHGYGRATKEHTRTTGTIDYYTYYYMIRYAKEKEVCLFKTPVSERYCVSTDCSRWYDIETNEVVNDMKTVETVYISSKMLDMKEQSEDFQFAMKYSKEFPSSDSNGLDGCCGSID